MAIPSCSGSGVVEREMTTHPRTLVDDCFEEEQYEAGISVLDQLRSPRIKPYQAHIRQLIYLALYPPPALEEERQRDTFQLESGSPNKALARKQGTSHAPPPAATEAALRLLTAFAHTNSPAAILRALPCYPAPGAPGDSVMDDEDSFIAKQAIRVKAAKNFWEVLKEGFIQRGHEAPSARPPKRKSRRQATDDVDDVDVEAPSAIGPFAWPILEWFVTLLEKDEKATEHNGQPVYSPFLLSQIPPSRMQGGSRWEFEAALQVVSCALQQPDARRRSVGARLLALLVNLASTTLVDFPLFLGLVSSRVSALPLDGVQSLFLMLPRTRTATQFRLALCRHYLADPSGNSGAARPRPQARAQPRPSRRKQQDTDADAAPPADGPAHPAEPVVPSLARKHAPVAPSEVLDLIRNAHRTEPEARARVLAMKLELLAAYDILSRQNAATAVAAPGDVEWRAMLRDGRVRDAFEAASASVGGVKARGLDDLSTARQFLVMISAC